MAGVKNALHAATAGSVDPRLLAQAARLDAVLEQVPLVIALFDEELRLIRASRRYHELTGTEGSSAQGRSIYDAFPNALADLDDLIDRVMRGEEVEPQRVGFRPRSASERVLEVTFTPITQVNGAGTGGGLLFMGTDVTDREQLRADLARSIAQLETIFDVIPDSVRVFDADGKIARSNAQAALEHGQAKPEALEDLWRLDRPRTLDGVSLFVHEHPTARALGGQRVRGMSLTVRRDGAEENSEAVVEVNSNPLRDESGRVRGAVTVERDVTERTRLSRKLEDQLRLTAELYDVVSTEAERLELMVKERTQELLDLQEERSRERRLTAVGQLAAGVMHDVNNALNPIMAAAYLLEANANNPDAVRDYAQRIAKAAETGAATAARVGRFIRQEPLQGERDEIVDLSTLADEVVAITRPLWAERARGGHIAFERRLVPDVVTRGIGGEIREALLNLVQNALDAMAGGGTLGITTSVREGMACIEVSDTGTGMTDEVRERAFEPFFTTKGRRGTGLGLSEVYGIAKRHRGSAEIESEIGKGTTVRLCFPIATAGDRIAKAPAGARPKSPKRVLVVEDNDDGRDFMRALLESDGHTVDAVSTMREALTRLGTLGLRYDVMVTDIGLPDGNGWDLVESARTAHPALRIGVVTGWEVRTTAGSSANFTLRKPVGAHELLSLVVAAE
ncbi:MAG: PAS domain-containing protein [Gemmatimonadaceae bacterium]|nr:PAS domain-containing protein [Gemmatimonadaceae bacterium]NUR18335.1 PAS domain-containing protein [Gemmatimonadaceae bacterium]